MRGNIFFLPMFLFTIYYVGAVEPNIRYVEVPPRGTRGFPATKGSGEKVDVYRDIEGNLSPSFLRGPPFEKAFKRADIVP